MNTSLLSGAEVSDYGEPDPTPDWFLRIGTAVVFIGCLFCMWKAFLP